MNTDPSKTPREELEIRLTALMLGELPEVEAAAWRAAIATNPELAKLHDRLKQTISLVREATAKVTEPASEPTTPLKLSEERREKLLAHFKTVKPREFVLRKRLPTRRLVELAAVMAILAVIGALFLPMGSILSRRSDESVALFSAAPESSDVVGYASRPLGSAGHSPLATNVIPSPAAVYTKEGARLFDSVSPPPGSLVSSPSRTAGRANIDFANTPARKPDVAAQEAALPPQIVLPSAVESESLGVTEVAKVAATKEALHEEERKGTSTWSADQEQQRMFYERNRLPAQKDDSVSPAAPPPADPGIADKRVQVSAQLDSFFRDLSRTPPPTPPPAEAPVTVNGAEQAAFAGRGVSPTIGQTWVDFNNDGVLDQTLTVTRAEPETRAYGLGFELADQASGARGGGSGGTGGAGSLLAQSESGSRGRGSFAGAGVAPAAQPPGQAVEELVAAGLEARSVPALRTAEPQAPPPAPTVPETTETVADKTPGLAEVPTVGRLFRGETERGRELKLPTGGKAESALVTRSFDVDPNLFKLGLETVSGPAATTQFPAIAGGAGGGMAVPRVNVAGGGLNYIAKTNSAPESVVALNGLFNKLGVDMDPAKGKALFWNKGTGKLMVRATPEELDTIEAATQVLSSPPATVETQAKIAEVGKDAAQTDFYAGDFVARYGALTAPTDSSAIVTSEESLRRKSSSIVLPSVEIAGKTPSDGAVDQLSLARKDRAEAATKVQDGRILLEAGRLNEAEVALGEAIKADPENRQAFYYLSLAKERRYTESEKLREKDAKQGISQVAQTFTAPMQLGEGRIESLRGQIAVAEPEARAAAKKVDALGLAEQTEEILPGGTLNFSGIDLNQALSVYSKLTGKSVLQPTNLSAAPITLKSEKPLTKQEAIQSLERVLALNGISMIDVGDKFVKALPLAMANAAGAATDVPLVEADLPIRKPATNAPIPQPEIQARENAFSTFSLNVSDVSFKLAAASLEQGQMPDQASIRSEEFINAFDYHDPEPPLGMPVAFAWERARYPFAHNRDLLRFSLKTGAVGRQAGRALNLVLLLDNSGSMERSDRVHIIREALRVLAGQLQPQDKISVITFARTPRLWVDGVSGDKAGEVAEQISNLAPQGGTNFEEGMNAAYATAVRHYAAGGINRVVMLTDGAANLGNVDPESLKQKVEAHRKQGIALDCFGIGWEGFNDDLLEVLSRNGDGRYGFINSAEEAATEFAGQLAGALQVAASDVKVQVEFNPARVTSYRQIGYAKHQLTKEQFRDNTVDAAEIAAQEAGNALYTVEVNPTGEGPLCIVRVRFKFPGTVVYREHEWAVPYNGSAVSLEQASPAMRLAASASAFSEWLVASPFAAEVTPDALLGYLTGVPEVYGADARPKKLEWMIRQAKSIEGK